MLALALVLSRLNRRLSHCYQPPQLPQLQFKVRHSKKNQKKLIDPFFGSESPTSPLKSPHRVSRLRSATLRNTIQDTLIDYNDKTHLLLEVLGQVKWDTFVPTPPEKRMPLFVGPNGAILGREMPTSSKALNVEQRAGFLLIPDEAVSRQHCIISFSAKDKAFHMRDLGSANNTFILKGADVAVSTSGPFLHRTFFSASQKKKKKKKC